jgi:hypothetical protein
MTLGMTAKTHASLLSLESRDGMEHGTKFSTVRG